ncbi:hypothetical protein BX666DRAFT_2033642 [Dichotomocladium elegans]|nr:hypothetical protein BX666DRAFT_2033642 [Dichotomocladium elegans]
MEVDIPSSEVDVSPSKNVVSPPAPKTVSYAAVAGNGHSQKLKVAYLREHNAVEAQLVRPLNEAQFNRVLNLIRSRLPSQIQLVMEVDLQPSYLRVFLANKQAKQAVLASPFKVDSHTLVFEDKWAVDRRGGRRYRIYKCPYGCDKSHFVSSLKAFGLVTKVVNVRIANIPSADWWVTIQLPKGASLPSHVKLFGPSGETLSRVQACDECFHCRLSGHKSTSCPAKAAGVVPKRPAKPLTGVIQDLSSLALAAKTCPKTPEIPDQPPIDQSPTGDAKNEEIQTDETPALSKQTPVAVSTPPSFEEIGKITKHALSSSGVSSGRIHKPKRLKAKHTKGSKHANCPSLEGAPSPKDVDDR